MKRQGRRAAFLPLLLALAVLAGCAGLPDRGPVEVQEPAEPSSSAAPFDFNPPGPVPDASPEQIVTGFLRALQATPASTAPAEEFLTEAAAGQWRPDQATVVYGGARTESAGSTVTAVLDDGFLLDGQGRFSGALDGDERELGFGLVREAGQWRIAEPPDALVVPRSYFATRYRPYALHFFDPTGSVLVPERVHLPWGPQLPTRLVEGLLAGPSEESRDVERSFFSASARLNVSVPVRADGVAEVPLTSGSLPADPDDVDRVLAQLAWTLRQVSDVDSVEVWADGEAAELPERRRVVEVTGFESYSPAVRRASDRLFAVRGTEVVEVDGDAERLVAAWPATPGSPTGVAALAVTLAADRVAVVGEDARRVIVLAAGADGVVQPVPRGGGVVRGVAWDRTDRLWVVEERPGGTVVVVLDGTDLTAAEPVVLPVPGATEGVVAAALSRDGTRLGLLLRSSDGPAVAVARVRRDASGAPVGLTAPSAVPTAEPLAGASDLGWRDASTLAVLTRPSSTTTGVVLAAVDGSSAEVRQEPRVDVLFAVGVALAADPEPGGALIVTTDQGRLHRLDGQGRWGLEAGPDGLAVATFTG